MSLRLGGDLTETISQEWLKRKQHKGVNVVDMGDNMFSGTRYLGYVYDNGFDDTSELGYFTEHYLRDGSFQMSMTGSGVIWYKPLPRCLLLKLDEHSHLLMVQFYRKTHEYPDPPPTPLLAFFLRYPNPFARHVLSVDILSRTVDPLTGQIHTTRLILKRGIVPRWASSWLPSAATSGGRGLDAWVLEQSIVDPPGWGLSDQEAGDVMVVDHDEAELDYRRQPRLRSWQGNLSFKKFMHVVEGGELRAGPSGNTIHLTTAEVKSDLGGSWSSLIREKIEAYGVGKFEGNAETSRKGMSLILTLLRTRQPLPETAEFAVPLDPDFPSPPSTPPARNPKERSPSSFFLSANTLSDLSARWAKRREQSSGRGDGG